MVRPVEALKQFALKPTVKFTLSNKGWSVLLRKNEQRLWPPMRVHPRTAIFFKICCDVFKESNKAITFSSHSLKIQAEHGRHLDTIGKEVPPRLSVGAAQIMESRCGAIRRVPHDRNALKRSILSEVSKRSRQ
jgi:hypothetical protein